MKNGWVFLPFYSLYEAPLATGGFLLALALCFLFPPLGIVLLLAAAFLLILALLYVLCCGTFEAVLWGISFFKAHPLTYPQTGIVLFSLICFALLLFLGGRYLYYYLINPDLLKRGEKFKIIIEKRAKKFVSTGSDGEEEGSAVPAQYRLKALRDIPAREVKKGDLGGVVSSYQTLSQTGECWISKDAKALNEVRVFENAWLKDQVVARDYAEISEEACLSGSVNISGFARFSGCANAENNVTICDQAKVSGEVHLYGNVSISGEASLSGKVVLKDNVSVTGQAILDGEALLCDNVKISGKARISGQALLKDNAVMGGMAIICGEATLSGDAFIKKGILAGNASMHLPIAKGIKRKWRDFWR
ncbi:polymer-forming cytoskeletal protein [Acetobacteraceae bacterium]|nr:polymer-forming cytoskeletal protein [Acetobacteraceae bacterium]